MGMATNDKIGVVPVWLLPESRVAPIKDVPNNILNKRELIFFIIKILFVRQRRLVFAIKQNKKINGPSLAGFVKYITTVINI